MNAVGSVERSGFRASISIVLPFVSSRGWSCAVVPPVEPGGTGRNWFLLVETGSWWLPVPVRPEVPVVVPSLFVGPEGSVVVPVPSRRTCWSQWSVPWFVGQVVANRWRDETCRRCSSAAARFRAERPTGGPPVDPWSSHSYLH